MAWSRHDARRIEATCLLDEGPQLIFELGEALLASDRLDHVARCHGWPPLARRHLTDAKRDDARLSFGQLPDHLSWREHGDAVPAKLCAVEIAEVVGHQSSRTDVDCPRLLRADPSDGCPSDR